MRGCLIPSHGVIWPSNLSLVDVDYLSYSLSQSNEKERVYFLFYFPLKNNKTSGDSSTFFQTHDFSNKKYSQDQTFLFLKTHPERRHVAMSTHMGVIPKRCVQMWVMRIVHEMKNYWNGVLRSKRETCFGCFCSRYCSRGSHRMLETQYPNEYKILEPSPFIAIPWVFSHLCFPQQCW